MGVIPDKEVAVWKQAYPIPFNFTFDRNQLFTIRYSNYAAFGLRKFDIDGGFQFGISNLSWAIENNLNITKNLNN